MQGYDLEQVDVTLKFDVLYHSSPPENRVSIGLLGLTLYLSEAAQTAKEMGDPDWMEAGSVFFSSTPEDVAAVDIWAVDVRGLDIEPDDTTECPHDGETWWQLRQPIPAARLTLYRAAAKPDPISPRI